MSKRRTTAAAAANKSSNSSSGELLNLTDNELRHRLLQYGFPNIPVTETTRKILIKKLQNHLNNEKTKLKRQTTYVTRYSSDEESDWIDSPQPVTIKGRSSRIIDSFRSPPEIISKMPPPATSTVLGRRSNNSTSYNTAPTPSKSSPKIYVPPPILASESEEESDYRNYSASQFYNSNPYTSPTPHLPPSSSPQTASTPPNSYPGLSSSSSSSPAQLNNITLDRSLNNSWTSQVMGGGGGGAYYTPSPSSPQMRETNSFTPPSSLSSSSPPLQTANGRSPNSSYGPDFTRRLLNLRGETIRDSILQKRTTTTAHTNLPLRQLHHSTTNAMADPTDVVYRQSEPAGINVARYIASAANDTSQSPSPSSSSSSSFHNKRDMSASSAFSRLIARLDEHYGLKQTFIPCALVTLLLLFFVFLAFVYITISPDLINTINEKNTAYDICTAHDHQSALAKATFSCIDLDTLPGAIELLKILVPELQKRSEMHFCSDKTQPHGLSAREFVKLVHKLGTIVDVRKTLRELHTAEYLIEKNPQWKIDHVDEKLEKINFAEVVRQRHTQTNHFAILQPRLPMTCTLFNRLQEFFIFIGTSALVVGLILLIHIVYSFIQNRRQMKLATVESLTNQIIAELMRQAITDQGSSAIVVNHLRDKIIPLAKRKEKQWAWNEAIRNLELNDSRIQFDMMIKNGEECKTMKWIANVSMDVFGRSACKQWQSPAFDKTNKIVQPPTSCLKIRQMFDPAETNNPHLKQIIQDAILEKVGPKCKIYDIQLDKQTCCVYVQCATEADAGIVHNEINGWWFDKRLVSIKFLRLQRYKSRFPNSSNGTKCLQPSNSNNLSMTQCTRNFGAANGLSIDADDDDDVDDDDDMDDEEQ